MRKGLIVLLVAVLAVAFALPAMADTSISGFYRSKAWMSNFNGADGGKLSTQDPPTNAFVEQRVRVKFDFGTENVKVVWFTEIDFAAFGDTAATEKRNGGAMLGGDQINLETKNLYLWFKIPDTSLDVTVGLQNGSDDYAGVLWGAADFAGIVLNGKYEPVKYKLGWLKLYENVSNKPDDATLYTASAKFVPTKDMTMGANLYFLQDDAGTNPATTKMNPANFGGTTSPLGGTDNVLNWPNAGYRLKLYTPGIDMTYKAGPATISGFAFYQWGTFEGFTPAAKASGDVDVSAYGLDLRADAKLGPGNAFFEGLYLSGGDSDNKYEAPIGLGDYQGTGTGPGGNSSYSRTRMQIMLPSWDTINSAQCLVGCSGGVYGDSLGLQGRGLWHIAAGYNMDVSPKVKVEGNIGYAAASKMQSGEDWRGSSLGTEVNAGANYNIAKGLDFGLYGAYVFLGDFTKASPVSPSTSGTDMKDPWTTYARINYAF